MSSDFLPNPTEATGNWMIFVRMHMPHWLTFIAFIVTFVLFWVLPYPIVYQFLVSLAVGVLVEANIKQDEKKE